MPFYYYYTFYVIGKNLDNFETEGILIWMGVMLAPVPVMLVAIYIMKSSALGDRRGSVWICFWHYDFRGFIRNISA